MKYILLSILLTTLSAQAQIPCNPADFNESGNTDTQDLLQFLTWFDQCHPDPYIIPAFQNYTQDIFGGGNGFDLFVQVNDTMPFSSIQDQCIITWTIGANSVQMDNLHFQSSVFPDGMTLDCDGYFECTLSIEYEGCTYTRTEVSHATYNSQSPFNVPPCENSFGIEDYEASWEAMINGPHGNVIVNCD